MAKAKIETEANEMKITIEMKRIWGDTDSPLKATANVVIDDCFVVHGVKLINVGKGLFLSMPSFRGRSGKWLNTSHPITETCRKRIQDAMLETYEREAAVEKTAAEPEE